MKTRLQKLLKRIEPHFPALKRFGRRLVRVAHGTGRLSLYAAAVLLVLLTGLYAAARYYLPILAERKAELEEYLSHATAHQVRIHRLDGYWEGLNPGVHVEGLQVFAAGATVPGVRLSEMQLSLAVLPLLWGEVRISTLHLIRPQLSFERLADGRLRISGFEPIEAAAGTANGEGFLRWLFRQRHLEIENGEFQWYDHRHPGASLPLTGVQLALRNYGNRHLLDFKADFPKEICRECRATAEVSGNPLLGEDWKGSVYLRASALDLERLPGVARERLPSALRGRFDVELSSEWRNSLPRSVNGRAQVAGLVLPLPGTRAPLTVREARSDVSWRVRGSGWQLDLDKLVLGLRKPAWQAGNLRLQYAPDEQRIQVTRLNLDDLTSFAAELANAEVPSEGGPPAHLSSRARLWSALSPAGSVRDLDLVLVGGWEQPKTYTLEADFGNLRTAPHEDLPGVENLSGHVSLQRDRGELLIDSRALKVAMPRHFGSVLALGRANGRLSWKRHEDRWQVQGDELEIGGEDAKARGELTLLLPHDPVLSPHLNLKVSFRDGNVAHAARYYPVHDLGAGTLKWLNYAFVSGRIDSGTLVYDGQTRDFPFRDGAGKFEIRGKVSDAEYVYLPGWEPLKQVSAEVVIRDNRVIVSGDGYIGALRADEVSVSADLASEGRGAVRVGGRVRGPVAETLRVLKEIKPAARRDWMKVLPTELAASGDGVLHLAVVVPYGDAPARVDGEYRSANAGVRLAGAGTILESINGRVAFNQDGLRQGEARARLFGGEATMVLRSPEADAFEFEARGVIPGEGAGRLIGPVAATRLSGTAAWNVQYGLRRGIPSLRAELDLPGLKSRLPAPLDRPGGLTADKLTARTERATRETHVVSIGAGNSVGGRLVFARQASGWRFSHGELRLGESRAGFSTAPGLAVRATIDGLDVDQWLPLRGQGQVGLPLLVTRVSADIRRLDMFGRRYGAMAFDVARQAGGWSGTLAGTTASGAIAFSGERERMRIDLDLAHLVLPPRAPRETGAELESDPRRLPRISLRARDFRLKEQSLGALDFLAMPRADGWSIERFNLTRPEMQFAASGLWRFTADTHASDLQFTLRSGDFGQTAIALGVPDQLEGGDGEIRATLSWPGTPTAARASNVSGRLRVSAKDGRFLQLKQGAARLFGILDLSSIGRYLLLDFSPVFGTGFAYEKIRGDFTLDNGNATTRNLTVKGKTAHIGLNGRVGLAAEDFDLVLVVDPQVSDTLTFGSWYFLGPQVAATVLAVQKLFKKQLAEGTRISYLVRGSWKDPKVTKLSEPPPGTTPGDG
jgi:uncharacterized protein (TIGR02099 family)